MPETKKLRCHYIFVICSYRTGRYGLFTKLKVIGFVYRPQKIKYFRLRIYAFETNDRVNCVDRCANVSQIVSRRVYNCTLPRVYVAEIGISSFINRIVLLPLVIASCFCALPRGSTRNDDESRDCVDESSDPASIISRSSRIDRDFRTWSCVSLTPLRPSWMQKLLVTLRTAAIISLPRLQN